MEYPKALYKGSNAIYDTRIADDLDQEIELRKKEYVDFIDLPDPVIEDRSASGTGSKTHDGLVEKLAWTEDQLETAKAELIAFKNDVRRCTHVLLNYRVIQLRRVQPTTIKILSLTKKVQMMFRVLIIHNGLLTNCANN